MATFDIAVTPTATVNFLLIEGGPLINPQAVAEVVTPDAVPPTITVVSPVSFPADVAAARVTPFVLEVTDLDPGVQFIVVTVRFTGGSVASEEVIYRRGNFKAPYLASSQETITDGLRLTCLRTGGWPEGITAIAFDVDALDAAGNVDA